MRSCQPGCDQAGHDFPTLAMNLFLHLIIYLVLINKYKRLKLYYEEKTIMFSIVMFPPVTIDGLYTVVIYNRVLPVASELKCLDIRRPRVCNSRR